MTLPLPGWQHLFKGCGISWGLVGCPALKSPPQQSSGPDHRCLSTLNDQDHFLTLSTVSAVLFKVYCIDHTYTTIRVPVAASVKEVISAVADKLGSGEGLIIVKMNSGGGNSLD